MIGRSELVKRYGLSEPGVDRKLYGKMDEECLLGRLPSAS